MLRKSVFWWQLGHSAGGLAAVIVYRQLLHRQYVRLHFGQISPSNFPSAVKPHRAHSMGISFSWGAIFSPPFLWITPEDGYPDMDHWLTRFWGAV
jgi:hypothetical protein